MNNKQGHITIYEHQCLKIGQTYGTTQYTAKYHERLEQFYGKGLPYYSLINKGVQFNEHVGVLSIGSLVIEVLPKADKGKDEERWRKILISMLQTVGAFKVHAPSSSALKVKQNFILDLYFELFVKEVEYLYHKGLVKQYRKVESNKLALQGSLQFGKHIQQNLVHAERFYVKHSTYDRMHLMHQVLSQTLQLLRNLNTKESLKSRIGSLLLNFPEVDNVKISESTFNRITFSRKTEDYKYAIEIAKLLLLNYHPDLSMGQTNVLALMFDMNHLWEQFIYVSLRRRLKDATVTAQTSKNFWKPLNGYASMIRPDIVITKGENKIVLDTKWKNIGEKNPSPEDLRQMFAYHEYYKADKVALVYPGEESIRSGKYVGRDMECAIIRIPTDDTVQVWQDKIAQSISRWMEKVDY